MLRIAIRVLFLFMIGLAATSAQAADVPPAPAHDWNGFYLGAQGGYGWGQSDYKYTDSSTSSSSQNYDGFVGGGTLGYNAQTENFVFGLEGDISYANISGNDRSNKAPCYQDGCSAEVNWFATGRARLGYVMDNFMPYLTGGVAVAGIQGKADLGACGYVGRCSFDDTRVGWTVGGGVEWGFAENWSAKAEYLYVSVAGSDITPPAPYGYATADDFNFSVARVGINYHF